MRIDIQRAYEPPGRDGHRVLVDRVWPRGRTKAQLKLTAWMKELGPSTTLRQWFAHDPRKWTEFKKRYRHELAQPNQRRRLRELLQEARRGKLTLVYGARDELHNQAVVLRDALMRRQSRSAKRFKRV